MVVVKHGLGLVCCCMLLMGCGKPYLEWVEDGDSMKVLVLPEDALRFGSVSPDGKTAFEEVEVVCAGDTSIMLTDVDLQGSGFFIDYNPAPIRLERGDSRVVKVGFKPDEVGQYEGRITLQVVAGSPYSLSRDLYGYGCQDPGGDGVCDQQDSGYSGWD